MIFKNARVLLDQKLVYDCSIRVEDGIIAEITCGELAGEGMDASGLILAPGFIDMHIHGIGGTDVMDGAGAAARMAALLPRYGVTSFLPTLTAAPAEEMHARLADAAACAGCPGARILGAHLEGPFLSPKHKGVLPEESMKAPCMQTFLDIAGEHRGFVRLMPVAPELDGGMELIGELAGQGMLVSIGHTGADVETVQAAFAAGARQATHLFNAMPAIHHRAPGAAIAALVTPGVTAELIADGIHVDAAMLKLTLRAKGAEETALISDSMSAAGMGDGEYMLAGQHIKVEAGVARLSPTVLAGSTLTLDRAVKNMVAMAGATPEQALVMASATPARQLGEARLGSIAAGNYADFVLLAPDLTVQQTYINGVRYF